jgi:HAD superfamily hydrolase (TIGR01509 family)
MPYTAVFWDNDGVLVDSERLYFRSTQQVLQSVGVDLSLERYRGLYLKESRGAWHLAVEKGVPAAAIEGLREERNRIYAQLLRAENLAIDGAAQTLEALAGRILMGVVTSSHRDHFEIIHARTGFCRFFDFVITGDDVKETKPSPEPYLRALQKSGLEPEDCVVIEDSARGLIAAKEAGLACWIIPTELTRRSEFRQADKVLSSLADVVPLLVPNPDGAGI